MKSQKLPPPGDRVELLKQIEGLKAKIGDLEQTIQKQDRTMDQLASQRNCAMNDLAISQSEITRLQQYVPAMNPRKE